MFFWAFLLTNYNYKRLTDLLTYAHTHTHTWLHLRQSIPTWSIESSTFPFVYAHLRAPLHCSFAFGLITARLFAGLSLLRDGNCHCRFAPICSGFSLRLCTFQFTLLIYAYIYVCVCVIHIIYMCVCVLVA